MRYVEARFEDKYREDAYRIYITKALQLIPQNKYLTKDYFDILKPQIIDDRSGDEILLDIMNRAGLKFEE